MTGVCYTQRLGGYRATRMAVSDEIETAWRRGDRDGAHRMLTELAITAAADPAQREAIVRVVVALGLARLPAQDVLVDPADVDDAEQATLIAVHARLDQFDATGSLAAWIRTIARNEALQVLRRKRRRNEIGFADEVGLEGEWTATMSSLIADRRTVDAAIAALDPAFGEPLLLRERDGLSYDEIADRLGIQIGTVRSRINRARRRVAEQLHVERRPQ